MAAFTRNEAQVDPSFARISAAVVIPQDKAWPIARSLVGPTPWSHLPDTARGVSIGCSSHAGYRCSVIDKSALPVCLFHRGGMRKRTSRREYLITSANHEFRIPGIFVYFGKRKKEKPVMSSMTVDSISAYHLRKDTLLEYLRSVFPTQSSSITVEVRINRYMA